MRLSLRVCLLTILMALLPCRLQAAAPSAIRTLSRELAQVKLDAIPLVDVVDQLAESTGGNFHVNWKALAAAGVDRTTTVTLHVRHVTVRKMLSMMVEQLSTTPPLSFYNDQGVIEITTQELADLAVVTKVYNVEDLLIIAPDMDPNAMGSFGSIGTSSGSSGNSSSTSSNSRSTGQSSQRSSSSASSSSRSGSSQGMSGRTSSGSGSTSGSGTSGNMATRDSRLTDIVQLIKDTVEPTIWKDNGGTATISSFNGNLVITAPRRIHERIGGAME